MDSANLQMGGFEYYESELPELIQMDCCCQTVATNLDIMIPILTTLPIKAPATINRQQELLHILIYYLLFLSGMKAAVLIIAYFHHLKWLHLHLSTTWLLFHILFCITSSILYLSFYTEKWYKCHILRVDRHTIFSVSGKSNVFVFFSLTENKQSGITSWARYGGDMENGSCR